MASPWKLLARLVSPRRQQRQEHGSTDDVKPDLLGSMRMSAQHMRDLNPERRYAVLAATALHLSRHLMTLTTPIDMSTAHNFSEKAFTLLPWSIKHEVFEHRHVFAATRQLERPDEASAGDQLRLSIFQSASPIENSAF